MTEESTAVVILDNIQPFPFTRHHAVLGATVLLLLLVVAGRYVGRSETPSPSAQPAGTRIQAVAAAARSAFVVHVVGAVRRPGLYRLREGARVADALRRAGGPTRRAELTLVNLAAPIADGTQVVVPARVPVSAQGVAAAAPAAGAAGPVHLNQASFEQLDALPGIGPVTAQKILDYRQKHGAFSSVDDLDGIPGIGPARLDQLREVAAP